MATLHNILIGLFVCAVWQILLTVYKHRQAIMHFLRTAVNMCGQLVCRFLSTVCRVLLTAANKYAKTVVNMLRQFLDTFKKKTQKQQKLFWTHKVCTYSRCMHHDAWEYLLAVSGVLDKYSKSEWRRMEILQAIKSGNRQRCRVLLRMAIGLEVFPARSWTPISV